MGDIPVVLGADEQAQVDLAVDSILATPYPNRTSVGAHVRLLANHYEAQVSGLRLVIEKALEFAINGQVDGGHHKAWAIDQIVRALTGCPMVWRQATSWDGKPYEYEAQGESDEYKRFVADARAGEDGAETYSWDEGIAP